MYTNRPPSRWSSLEGQYHKKPSEAQASTHKLVALGLLKQEPRANVKKKRDIHGVEVDHKESQSQSLKQGFSNFTTNPYRQEVITDIGQQSQRSNHSRLSSIAQLKERRNSMFASKGRQPRRERTFVGSQCAACEEPLEHILRGERILQLSCGHVSHEACFYEYIKEFEAQDCPTCNAPLGLDSSRGGGIDFANLNKLVKSAQAADFSDRLREQQTTPTPWETDLTPHIPHGSPRGPSRAARDHLLPEHVQANGYQHERHGVEHGRNRSGDSGTVTTNGYVGSHQENYRLHDYDINCMETALGSSVLPTGDSIPSPNIIVRSEFPTLSKSQQQQSLTCLVTVEIPEKKLSSSSERFQSPPAVPMVPEGCHEFPKPPSRSRASSNAQKPVDGAHKDPSRLEEIKEELYKRCENWHGLDFQRFGRLILHDTMRVSKDRQSWQDLECYLFTDMLICVKPRRTAPAISREANVSERGKVTLKGSILIKKHLDQVEVIPDTEILALVLSVPELPHFYLQFRDHSQLDTWRQRLLNIHRIDLAEPQLAQIDEIEEHECSTDEDEYTVKSSRAGMMAGSLKSSSYGGARSHTTAPTEYTHPHTTASDYKLCLTDVHLPIDVVVVIPLSSCMQGLKINVLRDSLRFLVSSLGERDRLGLVTFGSGGGCVPLVGMTAKTWPGWAQILDTIRPIGQKSMRADIIDGANVAMDLLMQRKTSNPLSSILLVSDSAVSEHEGTDFVVSRAEAAKVAIHSFGLGLTHKPDTLVELSTKTKANYTYVKDWMMLRECLAGCMGALQSTSHQNVKIKLRLPEGSPTKFVKISGALQVTRRATGRDAEVSLGDLRFGDKRDILVQLAILPDASTPEMGPSDPWDNIISGLERLGGTADLEEARNGSVEELPLVQADLSWSDALRNGHLAQLPRPTLLAITMLPLSSKQGNLTPPSTPAIPPHPSIVQRRMELLTSDMLSRAITLVSRGQAERAHHLLTETRSILKGLNKGNLPPRPPPPSSALPPTPNSGELKGLAEANTPSFEGGRIPTTPPRSDSLPNPFNPTAGIDPSTVDALDSELESSLEWISHPAFFTRDTRKAVLQAIGVISSQRANTFRTPAESLWASRVSGIKTLTERSRDWRESGNDSLMEE